MNESDSGRAKLDPSGEFEKDPFTTGHCTVYILAHFCPVAFFRQMIALKFTLKKTHF
jgi:hypothetical protein